MSLTQILQDSAYRLTQFKIARIAAQAASTPYVTCLVRGEQVKLTPEEAVRQLYVMVLKDELGYLARETSA